MTLDALIEEVATRLNLTSDEALERIGDRINERYRRITSSLSLITSRRVISDVVVDFTDPDDILPDVLIEDTEKVVRVTTTADSGGITVLRELSYDSLTNRPAIAGQTPRAWAVKTMNTSSVIITLDAYFEAPPFTLHIEGLNMITDLLDDEEPVFPRDFHDVLVFGAMSDELMKMEKVQLAQTFEQKFEQRLSDLKLFIATSAYADIVQGKDKPSQLWYRNWQNRIGYWW